MDLAIKAASDAVFYFQFNTNQAIKYVVTQAQVSPKIAGQALKQVMTGYKNLKS